MPTHEMHHPHDPRHGGSVATCIAKSSAITSCIAGAMLFAGIPVTTVLPTSAPLWMGFATLFSKR